MAIDVKELSGQIELVLDQFNIEVVREVEDAMRKSANFGRQLLRNHQSPYEYGDYAEGWRVSYEHVGQIQPRRYIIHNRTRYMLTHLLENGFISRYGTPTMPKPHLGYTREKVEEELDRLLGEIL